MRIANATCASCKAFPFDASGKGQCASFDKPAVWDDRACVLYARAKDTSARWALVIKLQKVEV